MEYNFVLEKEEKRNLSFINANLHLWMQIYMHAYLSTYTLRTITVTNVVECRYHNLRNIYFFHASQTVIFWVSRKTTVILYRFLWWRWSCLRFESQYMEMDERPSLFFFSFLHLIFENGSSIINDSCAMPPYLLKFKKKEMEKGYFDVLLHLVMEKERKTFLIFSIHKCMDICM